MVHDLNTGLNYATIQAAVNAANPGDTLLADPGTYAENVIVNKAITLWGAKHGVSANNRFANFTSGPNGPKANPAVETIITAPVVNPVGGNPGANDLIRVLANNVSLDGLILDGNNPALPASPVVSNGVNIDARGGITNFDAANVDIPVNNLRVKNDIIQNVAQRGISLSNNGPVSTGNLLTGNVIHNFGSDPVNGGQGISLFTNAYADIKNNTIVVDVPGEIGLQLQNFFSDGTMTWSGNQVTVAQDSIGIHVNLFYAPNGVLNVQNNTVNAAAGVTGANDFTYGIDVWSVQVGSTVALRNNTIGASGGQFARGINLWNDPTTKSVTINGGTVARAVVGIDLESVNEFFGAGSATTVNVSHVAVTGGSTGVRIRAVPVNQTFPPPAVVNPTASVTMNLSDVAVSEATTGILVQGFSPAITAAVSLTKSTVKKNGNGLSIQSNGVLTSATLNAFTKNSNDGILIAAGAGPIGTIMCNTFKGNGHAGLENQSPSLVNAEKNFWGDPSGPTNPANPGGKGDKVIGNVDFSPWATSADCTTFSSGNSESDEGTA
jgi:hypothetical protein